MRRPIVAGNWKMHLKRSEAHALARGVIERVGEHPHALVLLCPAFTALEAVARAVEGTPAVLGAQNMHWELKGAYTGEVAAPMLLDLGCRFVILGHSERRASFRETDTEINRKLHTALAAELTPVVCVGETFEQREAGETEQVLATQLAGSLADVGAQLGRCVVAYEPVWAIGTGRTASAEQAQQAQAFIRAQLVEMCGAEPANDLRILYGGSVKPDNAAELFAQPDVDGGLVGGASLDAGSFAAIVKAAG